MTEVLRVGVIGANAHRGWASTAHLPALSALPGFALQAVATTRRESAEESAARFGAHAAYDEAAALIADPEVDLVAICVKVPHHHDLAKAALEAGKHVFCEWPLAASLTQAAELAALAHRQGVANGVGLQGRMSPIANYARDLVAEGYVGELLAVNLISRSAGRGGHEVTPDRVWAADNANGASTLRITGGHSIDLLRYITGGPTALQATVAVRIPEVTVVGSGEAHVVTAPDVILAEGRLAGGAFVSLDIQAGLPVRSGSRLLIHGDNGAIEIAGSSSLHLSDHALTLSGATAGGEFGPLAVPERYATVPAAVPEGSARNTAGLYLALAAAIAGGEMRGPDFATALSLHELLDAIEREGASSASARPG